MMRSTQELVDKIKKNQIESIEITGSVACIGERIETLDFTNDKKYIVYLGANQLVVIEQKSNDESFINIQKIDLISKKIVTNQSVALPAVNTSASISTQTETRKITCALALSDTNYVALGDTTGTILVLNLQNMQIEGTYQAFVGSKVDGLYKNNGKLYARSAGLSFMVAADNAFLCSKEILTPKTIDAGRALLDDQQSVSKTYENLHGDIAVDIENTLFAANGLQIPHFDVNEDTQIYAHDLQQKKSCGNKLILINKSQSHDDNVLIYLDNLFQEILVIYKWADVSKNEENDINAPCHMAHFSGEKISHIQVLSDRDRLILVTTNESSYVYNVDSLKIIAKSCETNPLNTQALSANQLLTSVVPNKDVEKIASFIENTNKLLDSPLKNFEPYQDSSVVSYQKALLLSLHQISANSLSNILDALVANSSVKLLSMDDALLNQKELKNLLNLTKKCSHLRLNISKVLHQKLQLMDELIEKKQLRIEQAEMVGLISRANRAFELDLLNLEMTHSENLKKQTEFNGELGANDQEDKVLLQYNSQSFDDKILNLTKLMQQNEISNAQNLQNLNDSVRAYREKNEKYQESELKTLNKDISEIKQKYDERFDEALQFLEGKPVSHHDKVKKPLINFGLFAPEDTKVLNVSHNDRSNKMNN